MQRQLKAFCVGHTQPLFAPALPFRMLCPKSLGIAGELVFADDRFGADVDGASLAEYSQLFGLHDMVSSGDLVADDLYLFQYRKFVSPNLGGAPSAAPWVRVLTTAETAAVFPDAEQLAAHASRVAVGSLFDFGESISANYARVHVIEDLVMFVAACAASGALSQADIKSFATLRGIIPSPAVCYMHADLFVRVMDVLQRVWRHFCPHYHVARTGYQRRVAGYLLERLHSFLLCKWLMEGSEPDIRTWSRYVVAAASPSNPPQAARSSQFAESA